MFDNTDFKGCEILYCEDSVWQKEDLLLLSCKNGRLIDVGFYGESNQYCIMVVEDENWDNPCYQIRQQPKPQYIEQYLQKVIDFETANFQPKVQEILDKITKYVDTFPKSNHEFDELLVLLKKLRDMGLKQGEVASYIEMYAMRYIDEDKAKWEMACELLDRITGFCMPNLHIWEPNL